MVLENAVQVQDLVSLRHGKWRFTGSVSGWWFAKHGLPEVTNGSAFAIVTMVITVGVGVVTIGSGLVVFNGVGVITGGVGTGVFELCTAPEGCIATIKGIGVCSELCITLSAMSVFTVAIDGSESAIATMELQSGFGDSTNGGL